jgi:hypothetical protein
MYLIEIFRLKQFDLENFHFQERKLSYRNSNKKSLN